MQVTCICYNNLIDMEDVIQNLRSKGYRITPARRSIVTWVLQNPRPFLSNELIEGVYKSGLKINESTIYREINFLIDQGVIKTLMLQPGITHYESTLMDHHHHLYCVDCGSVQDINCDSMKEAVGDVEQQAYQYGFKVLEHQVEFQGLCKDCKLK